MDYVKEAEAYLKYYAGLKKSVLHARYMMNKFAHRAYTAGITTRNDMIDDGQKCSDLQMWREICSKNEAEIRHIDEVLCDLAQKEGQVLKLYYIEKMKVADIAAALDYEGRKSVYNLKSKALKNFSISLFGINALREI